MEEERNPWLAGKRMGGEAPMSGDEYDARYEADAAAGKEVHGEANFETATAMDNLANVLSDLERYDEAHEMRLAALAIQQRELGPQHPNVAHTLANLGSGPR